MTRLADDGLIRDLVVEREKVNCFKYMYQRATGTAPIFIGHVERERKRDWECMMQVANCKVFKATRNQCCPGLRVLPI